MPRIATLIAAAAFTTLGVAANAAIDPNAATNATTTESATLANENGSGCNASASAGNANVNANCPRVAMRVRW
jgi:hypothetical protein